MTYDNDPPCTYKTESCTQRWDIWPTSQDGKIVQLVNVYSGQCADVTANATGPYLIQYWCKGETEGWDNQRFTLTTYPDGRVDFSPVNAPQFRVLPVSVRRQRGLSHASARQ